MGEQEAHQLGLAARVGVLERALEMGARGGEGDPEIVRNARQAIGIEQRLGDRAAALVRP